MLFGSRDGFGLEFHPEQERHLLCVDIFIGGLHVNVWDNAFYPPLLVKKLQDELPRFRAPHAAPAGFTSPVEAFRVAENRAYGDTRTWTGPGPEEALERCAFLEWGECTNDVSAFAFPDGDRMHLACRVRDGGGAPWGTEPLREPTVATVSRASLVETLEQCLAVAEREWSARRPSLRRS
jgi:hypothetical protein